MSEQLDALHAEVRRLRGQLSAAIKRTRDLPKGAPEHDRTRELRARLDAVERERWPLWNAESGGVMR